MVSEGAIESAVTSAQVIYMSIWRVENALVNWKL